MDVGYISCSQCSAEYEKEDLIEFGGSSMCEECYQEDTGLCEICNSRVWCDELSEFDDKMICQCCYDDATFICERCGGRHWNHYNEGDNTISLCQSCYNRYYTRCESCSRIIINDNSYNSDDGDYVYCYDCYQREKSNISLHDYNYKPEPIFYGNGCRYFGVELELDKGGKDDENAEILAEVVNRGNEHIYLKTDGSLDDGVEIVTHPMSLDYHMNQMQWPKLIETALELGYKSHQTSTCGLHIHVNRSAFSDDATIQDECIARILFVIERFWQELLRFSRRTKAQIVKWCRRYGLKIRPAEILDHAKKICSGRYTCLNITNYQTIEFRVFRGSLKYNTIMATLQFVNEICNVAISMSDEEVAELSWFGFLERIDETKCPELVTYLKERVLYINEPIITEEEL